MGAQVAEAAPEVPRVADLTDDDFAKRGLVVLDRPSTDTEGFLLPDGRFVIPSDVRAPDMTNGVHEGTLTRLGFIDASVHGTSTEGVATARGFEEAYDQGLVRVAPGFDNGFGITSNNLTAAETAVTRIDRKSVV